MRVVYMARDDDPDRLSASEVRETLQNMDPADWARAEGIARLMARGLRGMTSEDLLDEVCVLLLGGERRFPGSVHPLVVLKTAMRSEADNARKSAWVRRIDDRLAVEPENDADDSD